MSGRHGALLPIPSASLAPMAVYAIGVPGVGVGAGVAAAGVFGRVARDGRERQERDKAEQHACAG